MFKKEYLIYLSIKLSEMFKKQYLIYLSIKLSFIKGSPDFFYTFFFKLLERSVETYIYPKWKELKHMSYLIREGKNSHHVAPGA